jgi:energy-coupling factor transporter ATP-binding protein EcfA2
MKRIDELPTSKKLLESMTNNELDRDEDIASFIGILDEIEGGYSLCIDGPWGSGKTFFVKQVEMLLQHENDKLEESYEELAGLIGKEKSLGPKVEKNYLPVYFNAWDVDTFPDPLIALVGTMCAEHPLDLATDTTGSSVSDLLNRASSVIDLISPIVGLINPLAGVTTKAAADMVDDASRAAESSGIKSLVESFDKRKKLEDVLVKYVDALLKDVGDRLVLFVDELDRCEPRFALRLLDEMKFISRNDRVIVVYSTCLTQLEKAVGNFYGEGFDAHRYLNRFFDLSPLHLNRVDGNKYLCKTGHFNADGTIINKQISEIIDVKSLSMRDTNRLISEIDLSRHVLEERPSSSLIGFIEDQLFPVVVAAQLTGEELNWHEMATKKDFGLLWKYTEGLLFFSDKSKSIAGAALAGSSSLSDADIYLNLLCAYLFCDNKETAALESELFTYRMEYGSINQLDRKLFSKIYC